jgi:predicted ester cyclase
MSGEDNKQRVRRFLDDVTAGNLAALDDIVAPDFKDHQSLPPGIPPTLAGLKGFFQAQRVAFPDWKVTIEDMVADGDRVWDRLKVEGTNTGPFMGLPPTGRRVSFEVLDISRFAGGKLVEHWGVADNLGLMQQLGLIPALVEPVPTSS